MKVVVVYSLGMAGIQMAANALEWFLPGWAWAFVGGAYAVLAACTARKLHERLMSGSVFLLSKNDDHNKPDNYGANRDTRVPRHLPTLNHQS